jgi:hypothetical protein
MITVATIKQVKFPPELIPDAWFGAVPAGAEVAPPILQLTGFSPYILELTNIQLLLNANQNLRARYDDARVEENTAAMLNTQLQAWRLKAKNILYYNFFGLGVVPPTPSTFYSVWAYPPTIAHKLLWGISLNSKEQAINQELGIANTVEKGLLPLPISQLIEREYTVVGEETHARNINIAVANTIYQIESIVPRPGELLVLTRIAAQPALIANNIQLIIDRDDDQNYATFPVFPLSLVVGGEVPCFIPALKEIRLTTTAAVAPGPNLFRYTYQRIKLNNILRVRFGLMSEAEAPSDLYKKVIAGVV